VIYLDSSCLLSLLWDEEENAAVINAVGHEDIVVITALAELETRVQLKAAHLGGGYNLPRLRLLEAQLTRLYGQPPYEYRPLSGTLLKTALRQHRNSGTLHCRAFDRLHLAAMEELKVRRLMTRDHAQAAAAAAMGLEVVQPGRIT
jgi:predicted nucleic acid-binding protein